MKQKPEDSDNKHRFTSLALKHNLGVIEETGRVTLIDKNGKEVVSLPFDGESADWQSLLDQLQGKFGAHEEQALGSNIELDTNDMIIYTDGGSRGNPGPSATGYVLMDSEENILEEGGEYLGITTNNQAEYQAVKTALELARKYNPKKIEFKIDSLLVVNQMKGVYKIKNRDLWPIHSAIKELAENFERVTYTHVRREFNTLADQKVNEVLDARKDEKTI